MAGEWFLVRLWLSLYNPPLDTIKGAFLGHSGIKDDLCLCLSVFVCFNLQPFARLMTVWRLVEHRLALCS